MISEFKEFFPRDTEYKDKPFDDKQKCKDFIHCLLQCRLLMDNYMIKGHVDEGNNKASRWEIWSRLSSTEKNKEKIKRTKRTGQEWNSITMLQSMMYFSQDITRVPWLTETLKILYKQGITDNSHFLEALRKQDLNYAKSTLKDDGIGDVFGDGTELKGAGTSTHHYWFYKLEYLLWELWFNPKDEDSLMPDILKNSSANFRMRHITSIEHVSPQSRNTGEITQLDRFGNLALISVGENSTYSDKDPIEKKGVFQASLKRGVIQSLKLAHIFSYIKDDADWNDDALLKHEKAIFKVLKDSHPDLKILWPVLE